MASHSNKMNLSVHGEISQEDSDMPSSSSNKINSMTPHTTHRSETQDTLDTSEFDSIFGERNPSWDTLEAERDQDEQDQEDYHRDPGEVNIHQFYPTLEHSFNRKQSGKKTSHDKDMLLAIAEEDSKSEQTGNGSVQRQIEAKDKAIESEEEYNEEEEEKEEQEDENETGVFSTAVDEEAIEAARVRNQGFFGSDIWHGKVKQRTVGLLQIVTDRAYEHYQKAMQMKEDKNLVGIITCLNKAVNLKTDDPVFYVERGEAFIHLCDFQSAILNYKKACLLEPRNQVFFSRLAFLFYFYGQTLFDQRLYPEALECFSRASEMVPDNVGYNIRSISCLAALQRHGECLALVNKRLETDHDNPDLYIMRAHLHEMFRNTTLCYYDVKDALNLDPDHVEANRMMSDVMKRASVNKSHAMQLNIAGKHREALQKISIAIETDPSVADFHVLRGALHRKLNDFNAAIDDFLLALDKCEHNEEDKVYINSQRQLLLTYNDFSVECFTKGFYEEAIILLNKAIKGEKAEKSLYVNRGDCFFKQSELTFAIQDYHQALELDPLDKAVKARISVIHNEFGVNLYQEKNYTDAETKFTLALQYNPQVGQYYISRSRCRYMMENKVGAREDLLMGILLSPTNEDIVSILSRLFPGKSIGDVINSPAAQHAKIKLDNLVTTNLPVKLRPIGQSTTVDTEFDTELKDSYAELEDGELEGAAPSEADSREGSFWKPSTCQTTQFAMCLEEKEFYDEQVIMKKAVEVKVKDALKQRKSLRYDGTRIQPLPPPASRTRYGLFKGQHNILTSGGADKRKNKSTNWRTFSLGMGGIQNV